MVLNFRRQGWELSCMVFGMATLPSIERMYEAVLNSDSSFEGVFYVAVKTTGIFCRPTCPARKPLLKNVEFFAEPRDAVYAGYRPCKRCKPLDRTDETPEWVAKAIKLVEDSPDKRVKDGDLRASKIEPERIRRYFKKHFGMTFHSYARGRRLGNAFSKLRGGQEVIEAGMDSGFQSTSGFRTAFQKAFGYAPSESVGKNTLEMCWINTPLGAMIAAADDKSLFLLEFSDRRMLATQLNVLRKRLDCGFVPGRNSVLIQLEKELSAYFDGKLQKFEVPIATPGTEFQNQVWNQLLKIRYGKTMSYGEMAESLGHPDAQRAVGKANGDNRIAILVPCHRVIRSDGKLCGYGGGLWRKQRLLELESGQLCF